MFDRERTLVLALTAMVSSGAIAQSADVDNLRYRGEYTLGNEVNVFCPSINSQCYWLSGATSDSVRASLRSLVENPTSHESVCVVLEGYIDREAERTGFAADYDGVITVTRLYGACDATEIITQGDLQHHRWILESIDGQAVAGAVDDMPELDFGERLTFTGSSGCNRISGEAILRDELLLAPMVLSTRRLCATEAGNEVERVMLQALSGAIPRIGPDQRLTLDSANGLLEFRLDDWRE